MMTGDVGTALYLAPEMNREQRISFDQKVDMYSLGIILVEMVCFWSTGFERIDVLRRVRDESVRLRCAHIHNPACALRKHSPSCGGGQVLFVL